MSDVERTRASAAPRRAGGGWGARLVLAGLAFALGGIVFGSGGGEAPRGGAPGGHEGHAHAQEGAEATTWTCSMHPQVRQPEPGLCPLCNMDLIPLSDLAGAELPPNRVALSERARALAKIRTAKVERAPSAGVEVFLAGRVEADETTLSAVTSWTRGRIDRLDVKSTGEVVREGQVVAAVYSAELYAAQQDLIVAVRQLARLEGATAFSRESAEAAVEAARERLRLLGASAAEVRRVEGARAPSRLITIRAAADGTVIERVATEGGWVEAGGLLLRLADLSKVWVQLDAYERDLGKLAVGQRVSLAVLAFPGETFSGEITFIDPVLDPVRRTARVRVEVENPEGRLRPGMAAQASVEGAGLIAAPLVVPRTAPLFTGRRSLVYVVHDADSGPVYEARVVRLGTRMPEGYPVIAGLEEGEVVVERGAFVIDADLQLRGGESMMTLKDDRELDPALEPVAIEDAERRAFAPVVSEYLAVQRALAADDVGLAAASAKKLVGVAEGLTFPEQPTVEAAWSGVRREVVDTARKVAEATSLEAARGPFEPLSHAVERVLVRFGNPLDAPVGVAFCPMARDGSGARWLQSEGEVDNAYYGAVMRRCGEVRALVPPGGLLMPGPATEGGR